MALLFFLVGCALLSQNKSGVKYEYIAVNDAYAFTDGGSIYLSLCTHESDAVGEDWYVWLNSPFGNGRLPNRLYCNGRLVEYGSPEEGRILAVVSQIAAAEAEWPSRNYIRFFENGTNGALNIFGVGARIKARRRFWGY